VPSRMDVLVCAGGACISSHSLEVRDALERELRSHDLCDEVRIIETGCMGPCEHGPLVLVYPEGVLYRRVAADDVAEIVTEHFVKGRVVERLLFRSETADRIVREKRTIPFFEKQCKIVLSNCGAIDPESIEEYIGVGGYEALGKALTSMSPHDLVNEMKASGLRGRGGAGFPTGTKWEFVQREASDRKVVVCNADEGDPGAFMDRALLEGDPHAIIEGMALAAYAVGAQQGYIYIRAEYPLAIRRVKIALDAARAMNLLGESILESGFSFDIEVRVGAGAFVCGEETALLASIEGRRGIPRIRPPYPSTSGLWGLPTLLNNVETYANVRHIVSRGSEWFSSIGTKESKGTKVFALSGNVRNTGLVEVPMGTTLGELVFDIGGGIPNGKKLKAIQTGGPSGGCLPAEYLNTPISYETLKELGAIVGSGGVIVLDEDTCMVNLARYFVEFTASESCGQCVPCRSGLPQMLDILDRITLGRGTMADLDLLEHLAETVKRASLCGLGQTAPNPVLSTLRYFRDEYVAHIEHKTCPAGVCAALFVSPCEAICPAGVDVPAYLAHIANGDFEKAFEVHMEHNPLPGICGRVCYAFCETKCQRSQLDDPVAVRDLKRFMADYAMEHGLSVAPPDHVRPNRVAVVGSGPAGLSCAYYLTRLGYAPVVYEALPVAGGTMATGIPEYRLPREILRSDIERLVEAGVRIELLNPVDDLDALFEAGYEAVFVSTGAMDGQALRLEKPTPDGVLTGVDFLKAVHLGERPRFEGHVVVIGGGNAAIDSARTALRLGAASATILYRRMRADMPASREEIAEAVEEGVKILDLSAPIEILGRKRIKGVRCLRMQPGSFDASARRQPVPQDGSEFTVEASAVIVAIGQQASDELLKGAGIEPGDDGRVRVDPVSMATSRQGVFVGGDLASGPATVIEAIGAGRRAAIAIDRFLGGRGALDRASRRPVVSRYDERPYERERARAVAPVLPAETRAAAFDEVRGRYTREQAIEEARRCLHCDRKVDEEECAGRMPSAVKAGSGSR
jgi:NADH-quinone oxidoreductase subunit F